MSDHVLRGEVVEGHSRGNGRDSGSEPARALTRHIELHPVWLYLMNLAPRSRTTQRSALKQALAALRGRELRMLPQADRDALETEILEFPWNEVDRETLNVITRAMAEMGYSANTQQRTRAAVRRVMRKCTDPRFAGTRWHLGRGDYDQATDSDELVQIKQTSGGAVGRALDDGELAALFRACEVRDDLGHPEHEATEARDKAVLGLLFLKGLRVSEVCKLAINDYHRRSGKLNIRGAKTGDRSIHLSGPARQFIDRWLDYRFRADRRRQEGEVFYRIDRTGKVHPWIKAEGGQSRPVSTQAVRKMLIKRAGLAGIDRCTTHDGRRTTISWLLDNDSLPAAQELAGHADPAQTLRYRRYSRRQHAEAIDAVDQRQAAALGVAL